MGQTDRQIDISCLHGAQQQKARRYCAPLLPSNDGTGRRTDTQPLHRLFCAYDAVIQEYER